MKTPTYWTLTPATEFTRRLPMRDRKAHAENRRAALRLHGLYKDRFEDETEARAAAVKLGHDLGFLVYAVETA